MIDGNISMEEDTELRDLVVQTLESNGVLAKVRAQLRASVFLALEEQESVMNPEPLLNKTVKQYLANSEGRLLFSLVREFLEYFGLDYTMSVYDPETYFGKEYSYKGRTKLSEELGIKSREPLLGEILKSTINGALINTSNKNDTSNSRLDKTIETSTNLANATFEISVPKFLSKDSSSVSNDNDLSDKIESGSESSSRRPMNITITDKKKSENIFTDTSVSEIQQSSAENSSESDSSEVKEISSKSKNNLSKNAVDCTNLSNKSETLIKFDESKVTETRVNQNEDSAKQKSSNSIEIQTANNVQNRKPSLPSNNLGKAVFFDEIIVDGKKERIDAVHKGETLLGELPPLSQKATTIFSDLPPLNGKKTNLQNISDLKELMAIAPHDVAHYEEDFASSPSSSTNEQSPLKEPDLEESPSKLPSNKDEATPSLQSEDVSEEIEEIDEEILSSTSCLDDVTVEKGITNLTVGITADLMEQV